MLSSPVGGLLCSCTVLLFKHVVIHTAGARSMTLRQPVACNLRLLALRSFLASHPSGLRRRADTRLLHLGEYYGGGGALTRGCLLDWL